jgi:hypothetical protein
MNEEFFRKSVRHYCKQVGTIAQREIERAVREGLSEGILTGSEVLSIRASLTLVQTGLMVVVDGEIELE